MTVADREKPRHAASNGTQMARPARTTVAGGRALMTPARVMARPVQGRPLALLATLRRRGGSLAPWLDRGGGITLDPLKAVSEVSEASLTDPGVVILGGPTLVDRIRNASIDLGEGAPAVVTVVVVTALGPSSVWTMEQRQPWYGCEVAAEARVIVCYQVAHLRTALPYGSASLGRS